MGLTDLLLVGADCRRDSRCAHGWSYRGRWDDGSRAPCSPDNGGAQHGGWLSGEYRTDRKRKGTRFPSREQALPMGGRAVGVVAGVEQE
jgi:hypothetical protein